MDVRIRDFVFVVVPNALFFGGKKGDGAITKELLYFLISGSEYSNKNGV